MGPLHSPLQKKFVDELIAEAPEPEAGATERIVRDAMVGAASLSVPLTVSLGRGKNWGEIH